MPIKCTINFVDSTKDCLLFSLRHHLHTGSGTRLSTNTARELKRANYSSSTCNSVVKNVWNCTSTFYWGHHDVAMT